MAHDPNFPANDSFLADFPPAMRAEIQAMINDAIVNALSVQGLTPGNSAGKIPVSNGTLNTNLNADKVDGLDASAFATASHVHTAATTSANGFMSNTDKLKLDGIAAGAEVNQLTFSNVLIGSTTLAADSKTDTLTMISGSGITLTPDAANDAVTIAVTQDGHSHAVATTTAAGFESATDKLKLDGIAAGAEVNQNAFSTIVAGGVSTIAGAKSDTFKINAGGGITVAGDATNKACTISVTANGHTHSDATASAAGFATAAQITKLNGIAAGAEVNQNTFSDVLVGGTTIQSTSKSGILEFVSGTNIAITPDNTNKRVTIAVSGTVPAATTSGTCTGNAATATTLQTARTIATSGDAVGTATSFNGSANITIPLTLAASGATAGTYKSVTVDAKGRVTAGTNPTTLAGYGITDALPSAGTAASATKLATARNINGTPFDGSKDITLPFAAPNIAKNFIADSLKMTPGSGLSLTVSDGSADIEGSTQTLASTASLALSARKAALVYATAGSGGVPTIGKIDAALPAVDANVVARWDFSNWDGASAIANSAVGNGLAVANNLTKAGTVLRVDGHVGYAAQGDGSTGYFTSANTTGFPIGAVERQVDILVTFMNIGTDHYVWSYGGSSANQFFDLYVYAGGQLSILYGGGGFNTNYFVENGKTYLVSVQYDGAKISAYVNGLFIGAYSVVISTTAVALNLFRRADGLGTKVTEIIHFIELRNKMRTPLQIAQIANKLCFPCSYVGYNASYPTVAESGYHEWKFNETSGTTVVDSAGTLNGTATGTTIVDSGIGLGKARKFNGTTDGITLTDTSAVPTGMTVIFVGKPDITVARQVIMVKGISSSSALDPYWLELDYRKVRLILGNGSIIQDIISTMDLVSIEDVSFLAVTLTGTQVIISNGVDTETYTQTIQPVSNTNPWVIGKTNIAGGEAPYKGTMDYLLRMPRALSQAEIKIIYDKLMHKGKYTIVTETIPAGSIALGFVKTDSSKVIEIDDGSYKYGRREKAFNGNRRVFLGWKYFSSYGDLKWRNIPFNNPVRYTVVYSPTGRMSDAVPTLQHFYTTYTPNFKGVMVCPWKSDGITVYIAEGGPVFYDAAYFNGGGAVTSGYIGVYAEVLEDD